MTHNIYKVIIFDADNILVVKLKEFSKVCGHTVLHFL